METYYFFRIFLRAEFGRPTVFGTRCVLRLFQFQTNRLENSIFQNRQTPTLLHIAAVLATSYKACVIYPKLLTEFVASLVFQYFFDHRFVVVCFLLVFFAPKH